MKKCFGFSRVTDILSGYSEADKVLYRSSATTEPDEGFLILPDMKWDLKTISSLYLVAISLSPNIRSLRDLERKHLGMLKKIKKEARRAVKEGWGLEGSEVKCYVHYQPSYCKHLRTSFLLVMLLLTMWYSHVWSTVRSFPCAYR